MKKVDVETLTDIEADLGEGPVWSAEDQTIYWIDVTQRKIFRYGLVTRKAETFSVSGMPGSIALRKGGEVAAGDVIRIVKEGIAAGEIRDGDPVMMAHAVLGVTAYMSRVFIHEQSDDADEVADEVVAFCLGGLLAN